MDFEITEEEIRNKVSEATSSILPMGINQMPLLRHVQMFQNVRSVLKNVRPDIKPTYSTFETIEDLPGAAPLTNKCSFMWVNSAGTAAWHLQFLDNTEPQEKRIMKKTGAICNQGFNLQLRLNKFEVPTKGFVERIG